MVSSTCPVCQKALEGDLAALSKHVAKCSRAKTKKKSKSKVKPEREPETRAPLALPVSFMLTRELSSQNTNLGRHWTVKNREKGDWVDLLRGPVIQYKLHARQYSWSRWRIERRYAKPCRSYDYANLVGGCKHLIDSLITLGVIEDDAVKNLKVDYQQVEVEPAEVGTFLLLLEATP